MHLKKPLLEKGAIICRTNQSLDISREKYMGNITINRQKKIYIFIKKAAVMARNKN